MPIIRFADTTKPIMSQQCDFILRCVAAQPRGCRGWYLMRIFEKTRHKKVDIIVVTFANNCGYVYHKLLWVFFVENSYIQG